MGRWPARSTRRGSSTSCGCWFPGLCGHRQASLRRRRAAVGLQPGRFEDHHFGCGLLGPDAGTLPVRRGWPRRRARKDLARFRLYRSQAQEACKAVRLQRYVETDIMCAVVANGSRRPWWLAIALLIFTLLAGCAATDAPTRLPDDPASATPPAQPPQLWPARQVKGRAGSDDRLSGGGP